MIPYKNNIIILLIILIISSCSTGYTSDFVLVSENAIANVYILPGEPEFIHLAVQDLVSDVEKIAGRKPEIITDLSLCNENCIVIGEISKISKFPQIRELIGNNFTDLTGKWEAYSVENYKGDRNYLLISGSDGRGTMFGIYDFIESYLGVDPLYLWTDIEPVKQKILQWPKIYILQEEPDFTFRGWFINDEDLLTFWKDGGGKRNLDYKLYSNMIHIDVIHAAVEALVRSRNNLFIPASFIDILNPAEERIIQACARRGIFLSQHHQEPMGVSAWAFDNYWKNKGKDNVSYSYVTNRAEIQEVWREATKKWKAYPNVIWQFGLRGIGDKPFWETDKNVSESSVDHGKLISEALADQFNILNEIVPDDNPKVSSITLWMEGSDLNEKGLLNIPENTIVVFADNSPGWEMQTDFYQTERESQKKYGIYYHQQLWSTGPHLVQGTSPSKTHEIFKLAVENKSSDYAIVNVGNIREFVLGIKASSEMLFNFDDFDPDKFIKDWCRDKFGKGAKRAESTYHQFFDSYQIHKETKIVFLLDGQIRQHGLKLINELKEKFSNNEYEINVNNLEFYEHRSGLVDFQELTRMVNKQKEGLLKTRALADKAVDDMEGQELEFFNANLIAQKCIVFGLTTWLEALLRAIEATAENNETIVLNSLEDAVIAFKEIRRGKELGSRGEKWENWYRGEIIMNMEKMENSTKEILELAKSTHF